jgi:purine-cytosine permease-like protein
VEIFVSQDTTQQKLISVLHGLLPALVVIQIVILVMAQMKTPAPSVYQVDFSMITQFGMFLEKTRHVSADVIQIGLL